MEVVNESVDLDFADLHEGIGYHEDEEEETVRAGLNVPIDSANMGFKLLQKMGWKIGSGLGKNGQGRVDPIPISQKMDTSGVGKDTQMQEAHAESTSKRKALESEVIAEENEEKRLQREIKAIRAENIKEEIKSVTAAFYCSICDKQYSKISEYETHLSSYDHHHRKRFKEMQDMQKNNPIQTAKKKAREDKEKLNEEKEMRRLQEAALARERAKGGAIATVAAPIGALPIPLPEFVPPPPPPSSSPAAASGWSTQQAPNPLAPSAPPQKVSFSFGAKPSGAKATGAIKFSLTKK
ncbi:G patch domain-containing protein 8 [Phlyctochytrium planicorne]|nr:G patch domain-containing protein 8 [Phlyctochytrium planicorne]